MKQNFIVFVIVIITISLLGLIGIQLYWISSALSVKESNFNRGVSEAVTNAVYKFNKLEMAEAIAQQQEKNLQVNRFFNLIDSINREYYKEVLRAVSQERNSLDDYLAQWQPAPVTPYNTESFNSLSDSIFSNNNQVGYSTLQQGITNTSYQAIIEFFKKTKLVNDLFDDIFSNDSTYTASTEKGKFLLDSLIRTELDNQGIRLNYEFGIYDPVNNSLLLEKTGQYKQELLESGFIFSLFPHDVFRKPEFLLIYFPGQTNYLLTQMNIMSGISAAFILVIISSFTYTIITIFRQKKLSLIKNDFINNMTHELKTPISTISLACQALRDKDVQKSETLYQNYINVINEENERLGLMTEKVLQTAQLEKGKLRLNKVGFNLHDVIENAIKKIDLQLKSKHGEIITDLKAEFSFVEADKVHLTNVVFNLLDNAIKYSPETPKIKISTENVNKGILIYVKDNGMGISKSNQKKIFDTLYRISTGNLHNVKGFGLGLSYVKAIVELHGGYVTIESELKKGSTFSVFMPFGYA